jgi:hypothetical protein
MKKQLNNVSVIILVYFGLNFISNFFSINNLVGESFFI